MTDNPHFPAPVPALWLVAAALADLEKAQIAALTRAAGAVATRNEKRTMVVALLHQLRSYVQVRADGDPENGESIIESAGMIVRPAAVRPTRVFSAKPAIASGEVLLVAPRAGDRASYEWEYSANGGTSWLAMPSTVRSSTTLAGLTPGTSVMFKYRCVTRRGVSMWSQPIRLAAVK